jgi:hypothetical protein
VLLSALAGCPPEFEFPLVLEVPELTLFTACGRIPTTTVEKFWCGNLQLAHQLANMFCTISLAGFFTTVDENEMPQNCSAIVLSSPTVAS